MTIGTLGLIGLVLMIVAILAVAFVRGKGLIEDEEEDEPPLRAEDGLGEIELSGNMSCEEAQLIAETTGYEVVKVDEEQNRYILKLRTISNK